MPAEIILSRQGRIKLYENLKVGDRIRIVGGKNKGRKGVVTGISVPNDESYGGGKYEFNYYFSVFFLPDGKDRIIGTSCNYVKRIKEK